MTFCVYTCGPITGYTYGAAVDWREEVAIQLDDVGIKAVSPMRGKQFLLGEKKIADTHDEWPLSTEAGIFGRDMYDVRNCDALLVNFLDAHRISIGSLMEIAVAYTLGKYVLVVMDPENMHNHAFVRRMASLIVPTMDEAVSVMATVGAGYNY